MKYIIIGFLFVLILLELNKIYQTKKLNKMLALKQRQLRVKDDEVSIVSSDPYKSLKLRLSASLVLMFALILAPTNFSSNEVNLKSDLIKNVSTEKNTLSDFSVFRAANFANDLNVDNTYISGRNLYSLTDSSISLAELSSSKTAVLKTVDLTYIPEKIIGNDKYILVVGKSLKDEVNYPELKNKLASEYNTVVGIYSHDLNEIETITFNGAYVELVLNNDQIMLVTKNKLFAELIEKDYCLPGVTTKSKSYVFDYDNIKTFKDVSYEYIYHTYTYDIINSRAKATSFVACEHALVKAINNEILILSDTIDGNTLVASFNGGIYREKRVLGTIANNQMVHKDRGYYYFITSTFDSSLVHKLSVDFTTYSNAKLDGVLAYDSYFLDDLLLIGSSNIQVFSLNEMSSKGIVQIGEIEYFEVTNENNIVALVKEKDSYFLRIYESQNNSFKEVSNYRIKTFENSKLSFVKYFKDSDLLLVEQQRANFDKVLYVISIGEFGIQGINVIQDKDFNLRGVNNATLINENLYLTNGYSVTYYNLFNNEKKSLDF